MARNSDSSNDSNINSFNHGKSKTQNGINISKSYLYQCHKEAIEISEEDLDQNENSE
jgi:hypothetical protein